MKYLDILTVVSIHTQAIEYPPISLELFHAILRMHMRIIFSAFWLPQFFRKSSAAHSAYPTAEWWIVKFFRMPMKSSGW